MCPWFSPDGGVVFKVRDLFAVTRGEIVPRVDCRPTVLTSEKREGVYY